MEVYDEPVILYGTDYSDGKALLKLEVGKSGIKNVTVKVGEQEKKFGEIYGKRDIEFPLSPGKYVMDISCSDVAGKPHEVSETVEFREKNFFEQLLEMLNSFILSIMSLFSGQGKS